MDEIYQEQYNEIRKTVNDPEAAKKLTRRYVSVAKGLELRELRKVSDNVYYIKEYST